MVATMITSSIAAEGKRAIMPGAERKEVAATGWSAKKADIEVYIKAIQGLMTKSIDDRRKEGSVSAKTGMDLLLYIATGGHSKPGNGHDIGHVRRAGRMILEERNMIINAIAYGALGIFAHDEESIKTSSIGKNKGLFLKMLNQWKIENKSIAEKMDKNAL